MSNKFFLKMEKLTLNLILTILILSLGIFPSKIRNIKDFNFPIEREEISISSEISCLAENIYHEAKGEDLTGKLAVAQVTINRVNSDKFPNTICDVVYQKNSKLCQFSWVCTNNKIHNQDIFEESLIIAKIALKGERIMKLEKSLFFHNVNVNPKWKYTFKTKIGNHKFYDL